MIIDFLLSHQMLPDSTIRAAIRKRLKNTLKKQEQANTRLQGQYTEKLIEELKASPLAVSTDKANEQHYEVPAEFYKIVLGPQLKYSSGYWGNSGATLSSSETEMLDLTIERADIAGGANILDLGCGWGSFSLYAAQKFPDKNFTAVSNSNSQREYITRQARLVNIRNLKAITADINNFDPDDKYDRIVTIEMLEHIRNYAHVFKKLHSWMPSGGKLFIHIFNHKKYAYKFEVKSKSDWMARHFFTGGMMPSDELLLNFAEGFKLAGHWNIGGLHYSKTLEAWLKNMDGNKGNIMEIFEKAYRSEAKKFWAYWRVFFMACSETFAMGDGNEWQVSHYSFEKV